MTRIPTSLPNFLIQEEARITSPGVDDLVLSGMLNGFSDVEALDLSVQFDLPDFDFGNYDNLLNFDSQVGFCMFVLLLEVSDCQKK